MWYKYTCHNTSLYKELRSVFKLRSLSSLYQFNIIRVKGRILRSYTNRVSNCLTVLRTRKPLFMLASAYGTWPARPWSVPIDIVCFPYFPYYIRPLPLSARPEYIKHRKSIHCLSTHSFLIRRFCYSWQKPTTSANYSYNINPYTTSSESPLPYDQ